MGFLKKLLGLGPKYEKGDTFTTNAGHVFKLMYVDRDDPPFIKVGMMGGGAMVRVVARSEKQLENQIRYIKRVY